MNEYYVYAMIDPRDDQIFYIGKGKGDRYLEHYKEYINAEKKGNVMNNDKVFGGSNSGKLTRIHQIVSSGYELKYLKICENLSEKSAFVLEEILVERFGRKIIETGQLENLMPGGNRGDSKLILEESDKTSMDEVKEKFPELISVLENYPYIATEFKSIAWYVKKIPKKSALYQYTLKGELMEVHHTYCFNSVTGMSARLIEKCIIENKGYAYGFQWSKEKKDKLENFENLSQEELEKLENFQRWRIKEYRDLQMLEYYKIRNQDVEE